MTQVLYEGGRRRFDVHGPHAANPREQADHTHENTILIWRPKQVGDFGFQGWITAWSQFQHGGTSDYDILEEPSPVLCDLLAKSLHFIQQLGYVFGHLIPLAAVGNHDEPYQMKGVERDCIQPESSSFLDLCVQRWGLCLLLTLPEIPDLSE